MSNCTPNASSRIVLWSGEILGARVSHWLHHLVARISLGNSLCWLGQSGWLIAGLCTQRHRLDARVYRMRGRLHRQRGGWGTSGLLLLLLLLLLQLLLLLLSELLQTVLVAGRRTNARHTIRGSGTFRSSRDGWYWRLCRTLRWCGSYMRDMQTL